MDLLKTFQKLKACLQRDSVFDGAFVIIAQFSIYGNEQHNCKYFVLLSLPTEQHINFLTIKLHAVNASVTLHIIPSEMMCRLVGA